MNFNFFSDGIELAAYACLVSFSSFVLHAIIWRVSAGKPSSRTLILLLMGSILFFYTLIGIISALGFVDFNLGAIPVMCLVSLAIAACYVASYPAVQASSPTFLIARELSLPGKQGLSEEELFALLPHSTLVNDRIDDLIDDGLAKTDQDRIIATSKGTSLISVFIHWKLLLKEAKGG